MKKVNILIIAFMFSILLSSNAFAVLSNYHNGRTISAASGKELTSTLATISGGSQPTAIAQGTDSSYWIMISDGVSNHYVQVGWKKDSFGTADHFYEYNNGSGKAGTWISNAVGASF